MRLAALLAVLALGAGLPATAEAKQTIKKAIWGPIERDGVSQFPIYRELGARIYQTTVNWATTAKTRPANPRDPNDPAYAWPPLVDKAIAEAAKHGMTVSVTLTRAPGWANGGKASNWAPRKPSDFADFATAASRRYPAVGHWMIWGEPARQANFQPLPRYEATGPRTYARILDAAYGALKKVNRKDLVIGGNTFVTGDVPALHFLRWMTLRNGKRPRLDLYGHNPFSRRKPNLADRGLGYGYVDFGGLDDLAKALDRYYKRRKKVKIFISEFTVPQTKPSGVFNFYVSEETAADWLQAAMKITRRWSRIYTLGWFQLYDAVPPLSNYEALWGLMANDGRKKPAYFAFRDG